MANASRVRSTGARGVRHRRRRNRARRDRLPFGHNRLFKLEGLEGQCEDYGQAVRYKGIVPGQTRVFELDGHHHIEAGRIFPICGNSWLMLAETRFAAHFDFIGDFGIHYGVFPDCGVAVPFGAAGGDPQPPAACC